MFYNCAIFVILNFFIFFLKEQKKKKLKSLSNTICLVFQLLRNNFTDSNTTIGSALYVEHMAREDESL